MTLQDMFQKARSTPSDINEHCDKLRELASQSETVIEFGMRHGVSTVALLAGQPKRMISYDLNHDPIVSVPVGIERTFPVAGMRFWKSVIPMLQLIG